MEWRPTFVDNYSISNTGILRGKRGRHIKSTPTGMVYLHAKNRSYYMPLWVLVAQGFIPPTGCILEHIDGNKLNNCVENLRYV